MTRTNIEFKLEKRQVFEVITKRRSGSIRVERTSSLDSARHSANLWLKNGDTLESITCIEVDQIGGIN